MDLHDAQDGMDGALDKRLVSSFINNFTELFDRQAPQIQGRSVSLSQMSTGMRPLLN
jgi:hypothetical protein